MNVHISEERPELKKKSLPKKIVRLERRNSWTAAKCVSRASSWEQISKPRDQKRSRLSWWKLECPPKSDFRLRNGQKRILGETLIISVKPVGEREQKGA